MHKPSIILITGIMAAGKSTIAQALAERLPQSAYVSGDTFRAMIVNGRLDMTPGYGVDALRQLMMRYEQAAATADSFCNNGFTAIFEDIIIGSILYEIIEILKSTEHPIYVIVLCPSPDAVEHREANRGKVGYTTWTPDDLDAELRLNTPRLGLWLDTTTLSVPETVDTILAQLEQAAV